MAGRKKAVSDTSGPTQVARIRALLVGINRYPHLPDYNQLRGCVNDTQNVASVLCRCFGASPADIRMLHDERATKSALLGRLSQMVRDTRQGEVAVFHMSSHGSLITRREPSGALKDHASEILCLSSIPPGIDDPDSYISDSDLVEVLRPLAPGALFIAILDACHSGADGNVARDMAAARPKPRFLCPPADIEHRNEARKSQFGGTKRHRLFGRSTATIDPHVIVLAACGPGQTSDDASFKGPDGTITAEGAFSHFLCDVLARSKVTPTYKELLALVQSLLSGNDDKQTPEMAPAALADLGFLSSLTALSVPVDSSLPTVRGASLVEVRSLRFGGGSSRDLSITKAPEPNEVIAAARAAGFTICQLPAEQVPPSGEVPVDLHEKDSALILEFADGVIVWHKPSSDEISRETGVASRKTGRQIGRKAGMTQSSLTPGARRQTFLLKPPTQQKGLVQQIYYVLSHPIQVFTREFLKGLERAAFQERLWYYHGATFGDASARTENPGPISSESANVLLFIHGVLSSVDGCFGRHGSVVTRLLPELQKKYIVLGYDHLSATPTIDEIATRLDSRLRACIADDACVTIVAHSQGGVIARALASKRKIRRIVAFGSPLQGTHLVNSIEKLISILTTSGALVPGAELEFAVQLLKIIDDSAVIPGFLDLGVGSPYLQSLNLTSTGGASFDLMRSEFSPDPDDCPLKVLAERVEQWGVFPGPNDLVIDTSMMDPPSPVVPDADKVLGEDRHVAHTEYFSQPETDQLLRSLL